MLFIRVLWHSHWPSAANSTHTKYPYLKIVKCNGNTMWLPNTLYPFRNSPVRFQFQFFNVFCGYNCLLLFRAFLFLSFYADSFRLFSFALILLCACHCDRRCTFALINLWQCIKLCDIYVTLNRWNLLTHLSANKTIPIKTGNSVK